MGLVFNEELENVIESIKDLKSDIEDIQRSIDDEIDDEVEIFEYINDYEYEDIKSNIEEIYKCKLEEYKSEVKTEIDSYIEELPNVFNQSNIFVIGKLRREEILYLLYKARDIVDYLSLYCNLDFLDEIINEILEYVNKDSKTLVNERKRNSRRNEFGRTNREQQKQDTICKVRDSKDKGLTQTQVALKLGLSKSIVSRYWNGVYSKGKWEIFKKQNSFESKEIIIELNETDQVGEIKLDCDEILEC